MGTLEQLIARTLRPKTVKPFATRIELGQRFSLHPKRAGQIFAEAAIGANGRRIVYSRAVVAALLEEWNEQPVGYPTEALLNGREASALLAEYGVTLAPKTLSYLRGVAAEDRGTPRPFAIRVGGRWRYRPSDLIAFAEAKVSR
jgi:hypothetical protein